MRGYRSAAQIISEVPISDGTTAQRIHGFRSRDGNLLESRFRLMPMIPNGWRGVGPPEAFIAMPVALAPMGTDGAPEMLIVSDSGLFLLAAWDRAAGGINTGLEELFTWDGTTPTSVVVPGALPAPPVVVVVGSRAYVSFGTAHRAIVVDLDERRVRAFGFERAPAAPQTRGPTKTATTAYGGGFSVRGLIGTTDGSWVDATGATVGGIDDGTWRYGVVFENRDGAYSATSSLSAPCMVARVTADPSANVQMEDLPRRFALRGIANGPAETVARVLIRTPNERRIPPGISGRPQFLTRLANRRATEWIDDQPDSELGAEWIDRMSAPRWSVGTFHSGSMWVSNGARVYWSEQTSLLGPTPESFINGAFLEVHPQSGPITAMYEARVGQGGASARPTLLVLKETVACFIAGEYPNFQSGILHASAGCAGAQLLQASNDGGVVWYGNGTFWQLRGDGTVEDIGGPIRKLLAQVNLNRARWGRSWVDMEAREVVFCLPVDDDRWPTMQFILDVADGGWRTRQDVEVHAACVLAGERLVLLSGKYDNEPNVFVYGRSIPYYDYTQPTVEYITGWQSPVEGIGMHLPHGTRKVFIVSEERGYAAAADLTLTAYQDWNLDDGTTDAQAFGGAHPDGDTAVMPLHFWSGLAGLPTDQEAVWGESYWRAARGVDQVTATDTASASVSCMGISDESGNLALLLIDVTVQVQASEPGGRTADGVIGNI
tara:strand:- start:2983 stop:5136 length:2154 start_codon:yes stop_codon:yes gene_type:complete